MSYPQWLKGRVGAGLFAIVFLTFMARIGTVLYFWARMPSSPDPETGHVYAVTAAYNTLVYVTEGQFEWNNFIVHYMMTIIGIALLLFAIFVLIPQARRSGQI